MNNQTIKEKKLLKQFVSTKDAEKHVANQRLIIMFRHGYQLQKKGEKNEFTTIITG